MPSRPRDPQKPFECFDPDSSSPRTATSSPSDSTRKAFSPARLEPVSPTEGFRKRSTTLRLPAIDPASLPKRSTTARLPAIDPEAFRKCSTTLKLPALDLATFHTRTTLPRIGVTSQEEISEAAPLEPLPAAADLWLIAGPTRTGASQHGPLSMRLRVQVVLLVLALLVLFGAQGFVAHLAGECGTQSKQSCLSLSLFQPLSGSQASAVATSAGGLPIIPDDLPGNVRGFIALALPYAVQAHEALGWPTSVVLAQWGLEHGWSVPDAQGYNWGNTEYAPGCPYQWSRFCYADSPAEGLREYIYTAQLHYYDSVRAAVPKGADATALALGKSPWDAGHYGGAAQPGSSLLSIMRHFNFYRFDIGG
jgi:hypothetical protein